MAQVLTEGYRPDCMPAWVPDAARIYLDHTECGYTIRSLARASGCHASTVLRKVQQTESRRDDPLVDAVLTQLGRLRRNQGRNPDPIAKDAATMTHSAPSDKTLKRDAIRTLRALSQPGAVLAVMPDVDTAVVVRENQGGEPRRIATLKRVVAEAMALKGWISCKPHGKVSRGHITTTGRQKLNRFLAEAETARAGFSEAPASFVAGAAQDGLFGDEAPSEPDSKRTAKRSPGLETPLRVLARRIDKKGHPYVTEKQVAVGERLMMDFELAQMENGARLSWDALLVGASDTGPQLHNAERRLAAKERLSDAIRHLGPDLGKVAVLTCCQQVGMEAAEARLNMPARSGKYVLRIALNMLARHYDATGNSDSDLIY